MKNIEKYEKELKKYGVCFAVDKHNTIHNCEGYECEKCIFNTRGYCSHGRMNWLLSEYKEPILDDVERKYLSAVIRPFRNSIQYIAKYSVGGGFQRIIIFHEGEHYTSAIDLPPFDNGMYKGMKLGEKYSIEELGL